MLHADAGGRLSYVAENASVGLDCSGDINFVSHAHLDHVPTGKAKSLLCSDATAELICTRSRTTHNGHAEHAKLGQVSMTLAPSGHVLGSRQVVIEGNAERFIYTGDLRTEDSILFEGAKPVECDTLLIESTYGMPRFSFPERATVYSDISSWVKQEVAAKNCVVIGGYALGKAQELVKILNEHVGITPLVSEEIADVCAVYKKHGVSLEYVSTSSDEGSAALKRNFVAVLSQNKVNSKMAAALSKEHGKSISTAVATGWAQSPSWGFNVDRAFCLSDHCDFADLCRYVEATGAKKVYVNHGYSREFARELKKKGVNALAVDDMRPEKGQRTLLG
ncbi:MAG: MBL fold metallo-hydrolase [Candidatus Micrarchaeia archaeon]|jgi:putative mRNA 3-end processing factor